MKEEICRAVSSSTTIKSERLTPIAEKVRHVKSAAQTRSHHCHWPGCSEQVPPAKWGCTRHWYLLPSHLRSAIWKAYRPGQEVDASPSKHYVEVARQVQAWIAENGARAKPSMSK